uniref:Uncharacterized protein n=1 Tax=Arundo donax TaxID=35708 RepID=A0A0A9QUV6_ARUDO
MYVSEQIKAVSLDTTAHATVAYTVHSSCIYQKKLQDGQEPTACSTIDLSVACKLTIISSKDT